MLTWMGFEFVCGLRPRAVHFEHFAAPATPHLLRRFLREEICETKWALWYGTVIVVRCEREVDRRLRRIIAFAHTAAVLEVGIAHKLRDAHINAVNKRAIVR